MKEEHEDSYGHVLKYTGIFGGVQGLNILVGLVRNKIVAYLLGPGGMGLLALFNSTISFISQATNLGISFSAVRHVSELFDGGDEERIAHFIKVVRVWCLLTALLGMMVCVVAGPLLSDYTFSWGNHTLHFVLLAPAVGLMAIAGGETAILKGARRLKSLATIQVVLVFLSLVVSVPLYFFFGESAIVPVIVLLAFFSTLCTVYYSYRLYPLRLHGEKGILGEGMTMVRLGVAFVLAGIMGSGAEMIIRSYLNVYADLDMVGFYNAGFMITVTYAGMVFSAMETDYFPRLSAVGNDVTVQNLTINRQIEVSLLIVSPMLCVLIVFAPIIIPMLYTGDFMPVVPMTRVAVFAMYVKALSLPVSYLLLAKGNSMGYLLVEGIDSVLLVLFVLVGYHYGALFGMGAALALHYVVDFFIVYLYIRLRYHYRMSGTIFRYMAVQLSLGVAAYLLVFVHHAVVYWLAGVLLCLASLAFSVYVLHQKTALWNALMGKVRSKLGRHA